MEDRESDTHLSWLFLLLLLLLLLPLLFSFESFVWNLRGYGMSLMVPFSNISIRRLILLHRYVWSVFEVKSEILISLKKKNTYFKYRYYNVQKFIWRISSSSNISTCRLILFAWCMSSLLFFVWPTTWKKKTFAVNHFTLSRSRS